VVEANWSAMNERGRKSKQERERQTGFLRDGETKKGIQLEKRRNEFTRKEDGEYIETEITQSVGNRNERERSSRNREREREKELEIKRTQNRDGNRKGAHWKPLLQRRVIE